MSGGEPFSIKEILEGSDRCGGDSDRFWALALGSGVEPVALNKVIKLGCPALPFNDSVDLVFDYGFHPVLLFAEAVGLLATISGFLPGDWRVG